MVVIVSFLLYAAIPFIGNLQYLCANDESMETRNESSTPWMATHPGTILKYELEERRIPQKDFAVMIGMQKSHVSELLNGKRPMTMAIAYRIEEKLGISAITLVNLQTNYEYDLIVLSKENADSQQGKRLRNAHRNRVSPITAV